jgi:hypothetical protein
VCSRIARSRHERDELVLHAESGRDLGWYRTIATYVHDGSAHRVPVGVVFQKKT